MVRTCVYKDRVNETLMEEKFPVFSKDLFFSVFRPPSNAKDRRVDDGTEADPNLYMKFLRHLGTGRIGKSCIAKRIDLTPYATTFVPKQDLKLVVIMTMMDAKRVNYIDAVRAVEPFSFKGEKPSPFLGKILLTFKSSLPYLSEFYYFISEYWTHALSICHRLQQVGRLCEGDVKFYIMELIEAVAYIHQRGKILRRICLCSLMIAGTGHLKLVPYTCCDQNLNCGQACNMLVKNCGDQFYASPEVVFGVDVQFTADWWSLGVVMYQLLTGELPFTGRTLGDLGKAITESPLCPSDCISGEAAAFLKQILHKDPRRRLGFSGIDTIDDSGAAQVKDHPFFQGTKWEDVDNLLMIPPFIPRTATLSAEEILRKRMETVMNKEPSARKPDKATLRI